MKSRHFSVHIPVASQDFPLNPNLMIASTQTNQPFSGASTTVENDEVKFAVAKLKAAGLRITRTRLGIISTLSKFREPASIEQLHRHVHASGCDLVTVYRCMTVFEDIGLVQKCFTQDGTTVYGLTTNGLSRYYVMCKDTAAIHELDPQFSGLLRQAVGIVEDMLRARGYSHVGHLVEFFVNRNTTTSHRA